MDPLTLYLIGTGVSLGAQGIASGIQGMQGRKEARKAEAREEELRAAGMPKMETPEEYLGTIGLRYGIRIVMKIPNESMGDVTLLTNTISEQDRFLSDNEKAPSQGKPKP